MILQNSTDIKTELFLDENGDISPIDINHEKHIINPNGLVQLQNIPSPHTVFTIVRRDGVNMINYNKVDEVISQYDFKVDYLNGILTFHSSQIGMEVKVSYTNAIGRLSISADRIFTSTDNQGNIIQTLNTLIKEGQSVLSTLDTVGGASQIIQEMKGYMDSIKSLTSIIIEGANTSKQLKTDIYSAKTEKANLVTETTKASEKIAEMNTWVQTNGNVVDLNNRVKTNENKLNTVNSSLEHIETQINDMILVGEVENTDIANEILQAYNKTNHVRIRKGNFNISNITLPRSNLTLDCEDGCKLTMLSMIGIFATGKENININNLNIDGAGILSTSDMANGSTSIYMENVKNLTIENVKTDNTGAWGIAVTNGSKNITLTNNKCNGSIRQSGIAISGNCTEFTVDGNYCNNNYYSGIIIEPLCKNGDVINNKCTDNDQGGITIVDCENATIRVDNNTIVNSKGNIISIRNQKVYITNNKIVGGALGVQVEKTNLVDVKNNNISDCNSMAISMLSGDGEPKMVDVVVTGNSAINCTLTDTREHVASYFIRDCDNLIFKDNVSNNNKTRDYSLTSNSFLDLSLVPSYTKAPNISLLNKPKKPNRFVVVLDSNHTSETIVTPYDIDIYYFTVKKTVVTSNGGYTQININDSSANLYDNENNNANKIIYTSQYYSKRFLSGEEIKISYAHSINMGYVKDIEVELFYF